MPDNWAKLVANSREKSTDDFFDLTKTYFEPEHDETAGNAPTLTSNPANAADLELAPDQPSVSETGQTTPVSKGGPSALPTVTQDFEGDASASGDCAPSEGEATPHPFPSTSSEGDITADGNPMPKMINLEASGLRRSPRIAVQERKNYSCITVFARFCAFGVTVAAALSNPVPVFSHGQARVNAALHECDVINTNFDKSLNHLHHMALAAGQTHNEVYTFSEMLKQDDRKEFVAAMETEVRAHEEKKHWEVVPRASLPAHVKTI